MSIVYFYDVCMYSSEMQTPQNDERVWRRERRRQEKRRRILTAARELAETKGLSALTARRLAAETGYVPGAIYSYFPSMDVLKLALAVDMLSDINREIKPAKNDLGTPVDVAAAAGARAGAVLPLLAAARGDAAGQDAALARALTGRVIALLQTLRAPLAETMSDLDDAALASATVGLAALVLGLELMGGQLDQLGVSRKSVLDQYVAGLERGRV